MLLESYLSLRVQYVKFGQDVSSTTQLKTGVPQGSVLGPILFTSFISPIQFVASQFKVDQQQYADDTQVFISLSKSNSPDRVSRSSVATIFGPPSKKTFLGPWSRGTTTTSSQRAPGGPLQPRGPPAVAGPAGPSLRHWLVALKLHLYTSLPGSFIYSIYSMGGENVAGIRITQWPQ